MRNRAKHKLRSGETVAGFMVTLPSVGLVQVLAAAGADLLILDMEHGALDLPSVHAMVAATNGTGATPIVRVPWTEAWLVKPVLDTGAMGINFPMTSNAGLARAAVASMRYPPAGVRGHAPASAPLRWGLSTPEYLRVANDELLTLITIEDRDGVDALPEILAVEGIDAVAIASFDLSMSLGVPGQFDHPEVRALVARAEAAIRAAGLPLGGVSLTREAAEAKRAAGYQLLLVGFDVLLIEQAAREAVTWAGSRPRAG